MAYSRNLRVLIFMSEENRSQWTSIDLSLLKNRVFCPGDIYFIKKSGPTLLFRAATLLDEPTITKIEKFKDKLEIDLIHNEDFIFRGKHLFSTFKKKVDYYELINLRRDLIIWFSRVLWEGKEKVSFVDFMAVAEEEIMDFTLNDLETFQAIDVNHFSESFRGGILLFFTGLLLGVVDFHYLKDLFHLYFALKLGLKDKFSFELSEGIQKEKEKGGLGISYLNGLNTGKKLIQTLRGHLSSMVVDKFTNLDFVFSNSHSWPLLSSHHERVDGTGFARGLKESELTDMEMALIFCYHFTRGEFKYHKEDASTILKQYFNKEEKFHKDSGIINTRIRHIMEREIIKANTMINVEGVGGLYYEAQKDLVRAEELEEDISIYADTPLPERWTEAFLSNHPDSLEKLVEFVANKNKSYVYPIRLGELSVKDIGMFVRDYDNEKIIASINHFDMELILTCLKNADNIESVRNWTEENNNLNDGVEL